ncbi:MAG: glycoside hydrolase family 9 protein [Terracidiphilus sp.]
MKVTQLLYAVLVVWVSMICVQSASSQVRVLTDQVGYESTAVKQAIVVGTEQDGPGKFELIDTNTAKAVYTGDLKLAGQVFDWKGRTFWIADFSGWRQPGHYAIQVHAGTNEAQSCPFEIQDDILERDTLSNVIFYFKGQRSSGTFDQADRHLATPGSPGTFVDVHGGWYDATGDYGIHFSHQNLTSYFNPQQVPLVVWSLLSSYNQLKSRNNDNFSEYERRLLDEGLFGADFLVRMKRPDGSFFETIAAPGREKLAKDREIGNPNFRTRIKTTPLESTESTAEATGPYTYEVSFRSGGGMAIAALALASAMPEEGEFPHARYLMAAEEAFQFLDRHNRELVNDGVENILDDYCALMAATELYKASHEESYRTAATLRAQSLMARLTTSVAWRDYWRADVGTRPYFHPSDAGLPVVSLLDYAVIASPEERQKALRTVERSLRFELAVTAEVNNPFGYARQLVRTKDGKLRTAFFFPHDTEAAPWWQGENARIGSLAAAARLAVPFFPDRPEFQAELRNYAWNQLHWILGRNPFDTSMLMGSGHNNAAYMFFQSYKYTSAPGAVLNGITSALDDEDGIAFNQGFAVTGKDEDWRWTEEWLPHAAWYLSAISLPH